MLRVVLFLIVVLFSACESDETRMSRMADDLCNCFSSVNDVVSAETLSKYDSLWKDDDIVSFERAWNELDSATIKKMTDELSVLGERMLAESEPMQCVSKLHAKYGIIHDLNNSGHAEELRELLEARSECRVAVYYLKTLERIRRMKKKLPTH